MLNTNIVAHTKEVKRYLLERRLEQLKCINDQLNLLPKPVLELLRFFATNEHLRFRDRF